MKILCFNRPRFVHFQPPVLIRLVGLLGPALVVSGLLSCAKNAQLTATHSRKLRLHTGEIREISLRSPADTSAQLLAASENKEVVDVSRRDAVRGNPTPAVAHAARVVFLLKGVTAGTARIVFSEKPAGQESADRIRKSYLVEVVTN